MRSIRTRAIVPLFSVLTALVLVSGFCGASVRAASPHPISGTLTQALNEDPKTLDPSKMSLADEDTIALEIGASLVTVNPSGQIVPWLATSWVWSNGDKTITFKIRPGVKFQASGKTMTAQDIKATYERALNPKTGSPVAAQELTGVKSIAAPNASTLVFNLESPNGSFLMNISDAGYLQPIDPVQLKKYGAAYGLHPSSVGPYELKNWTPGVSVTLVRNPAYNWAPPFDDPGAPYIKTLVFQLIPQTSSQVAAFNSGQLTLLTVAPQYWSQYQHNAKYNFFSVVDGRIGKLDFNLREPMFKDVRVRQAFSYSLNRAAIVRGALNGHGLPGWGPYPPNLIYFDKATNNAYPYNPKKAKQLMEAAGYQYNSAGWLMHNGQRVSLRLYVRNDGNYPLEGQIVQADLQAIGITTQISTYDFSTMASMQTSGNFDLAVSGFAWAGADPITVVQIEYQTKGGLNLESYSDPTFDKMLSSYVDSTVPAQRQALAYQIQKYFVKNVPAVTFCYDLAAQVAQKKIGGLVINPFTGALLLDNAYVK